MKDCLHVTTDPETRAALRALNDLNLGALAANAGISMAGFAEGRSMGGLGPIPVNLHALVLHEAGVMAQAMRGEWVEACQELAALGAKVRAAMQPVHVKIQIDTSAALAAVGDMRAALEQATKATIAAREEQAALVASIRANGMVDAAWTSAEDAGLKALGDYLKGKPDAVQVPGHPDYPCHHWHTLTATRSELGQRRNEVASLKNTVAGRDAQIRKMEQRHVAAVFIERERTARVEVDLLGTINAITRQRDAADQQVAQAHRDRDDQWARADRSEAARAEAVRKLEALRNR